MKKGYCAYYTPTCPDDDGQERESFQSIAGVARWLNKYHKRNKMVEAITIQPELFSNDLWKEIEK